MLRYLIGAIIILASIANARDLAIISITSDTQARAATEILGGAHGAVDDGYLVAFDEPQFIRLMAAGITPQIIKRDCEPGEFALLYLDKSISDDRASELLPVDAISVDRRVSLVSAMTTVDGKLAHIWRFEEPSVAFIYRPPVFAVLPQLEEYPTDSLALLVNHDSVLSYVLRLQAFHTRYYASDSTLRTVEWLVEKFRSWGYTDVSTPPFQYLGNTYVNVKAVKLGYAEPEQIILLGAHLDSYNPSSGQSFAPGADDDASGVAAVLELARILKDIPLRKTVIFMPFNVEEPWMKGSFPAAQDFYDAGARIEVLLNYDMIAYVNDVYLNIGVAGGPNRVYAELQARCGNRVTFLDAVPDDNYVGNGDHWPFHLLGYPIVRVYESDIAQNWTYHTGNDVMANMNSQYMAEAVRMAAATVGYVAAAGSPTAASDIIDMGDGQSVTMIRPATDPSCTYYIRYGTTSGVYTDSITVAASDTAPVISGLNEGVTYYFSVIAVPPGGYSSVYAIESSQTPLLVPRQPTGMVASAETTGVMLQWLANREADIASYTVYRRPHDVGSFTVLAEGLESTSYTDTAALRQIGYEYMVSAVDQTGYESIPSMAVESYRATFDGGPLLVDEFTTENLYQPTQAHQLAWFDSLFDPSPYFLQVLDSAKYFFNCAIAGRSSSLFWIDDDNYVKLAASNIVGLDWYLAHSNNALISGWRTMNNLCPTVAVPDSNVLRREFGVIQQAMASWPDFVGAFGDNGWPSVEILPDRGLIEIAYVPIIEPAEGATVIYRYNSSGDDPAAEGLPCGLLVNGPRGKRVILGFPLWYLSPSSSRAIIQKALSEFGEASIPAVNGDVDLSGMVDIGDVSILLDHLFLSFTPLLDPDRADVDGSCNIDIQDLTNLVVYLFLEGAAPVPGCVP